MSLFRLIIRSLRHFRAGNLATAAGIAIATTIICGALIIGDSLRYSLLRIVDYRLGEITYSITAGERIFTSALSERLREGTGLQVAAILKTEASVSAQGSSTRAKQVHVWGVDSLFTKTSGQLAGFNLPNENEASISQNLALRLGVDTGDFLLLRMKSIGPIPVNTPLVSENEQTVTRRVRIVSLLDNEALGGFSMQASQTSPYNVFVNKGWLNGVMAIEGMANMVVISQSSQVMTDDIREMLRNAWHPADGSLVISPVMAGPSASCWHIRSDRVFIDDHIADAIQKAFTAQEQAFTYFVNSLSFKERATPYSFVTATDRSIQYHDRSSLWPVKQGEMLINQWLADDLGAAKGDSITIRFYEIGPLRELLENEAVFRVSGVLPMTLAQADSILMPQLPGLSDAGSCRDWEAGIPVDLDAIRQKDEDYWGIYRGTPKAYISLHDGQQLWKNRFGNLSSVCLPYNIYHEKEINELLSKQVDPFLLGFMVNPVREQGLLAASQGEDFGQLFVALGVFIIVSGLLLTALLLGYNLKRRESQIRLFSSLGFTPALTRKVLLWETFFVSLLGVLAGAAISAGYSKLVFNALNTNWHDIVRTDILMLYIRPASLTAGLLISLVLAMMVSWLAVNKTTQRYLKPAYTRSTEKPHKTSLLKGSCRKFCYYATIVLFVSSLLLITFLGIASRFEWLFAWFAAGVLLLLSCMTGIMCVLLSKQRPAAGMISLVSLSKRNIHRNPLRSISIVALLALGSFVIVVTAANRKDAVDDSYNALSGTGGFQYMAETTTPIPHNLNLPETRLTFGIPEEVSFLQLFSVYDDDASCLNLNMVANPRMLATDPGSLKGRFTFVTGHAWLNHEDPWSSLHGHFDGLVPAIADQTVIRWGLGKKTGDTLVYVNARGEEVRLLLIGGLANSVFQGNVIISLSNFLQHFPASGGTDVLLVEALQDVTGDLHEDLDWIFRDYGWEMTTTTEKLAAFNSVENTYLRIFFLMGAFGMLLGTIGLAVVLAKSLIERRAETALLRALGYTAGHIIRLFFTEYALLFVAGMLAGTLPALVATLPNFLTANQHMASEYLIMIILALLINGVLWMLTIPALMIRQISIVASLRND